MADEAKKEKKGFWKEFREFIARGNVLDLAVGVIIGSAFTAIVNSLCNNILKPIINWILALIFGSDSLTGVYTVLKEVLDETGALDLTASIYIDWGTFISAIINFLLVALVLFTIVRTIMHIKNTYDDTKKAIEENAEKRKEAREAAAAADAADDAAAEGKAETTEKKE